MNGWRKKALIFDVDGTLAETEEAHRKAFNLAFGEFGLDWHWSMRDYRQLLLTTGGKERIRAHMVNIDYPGELDVPAIHARKTELYSEIIASGSVPLRPGVKEVILRARQDGVSFAISTTTSRPNIDALLKATFGVESISWFAAIACGDEVKAKKPAPDVYDLALERLGLGATDCIAFEDSLNGLESAKLAGNGAGIETIITPSIYTDDQDFSAADLVIKDLTQLGNWLLRTTT